MIVKMQKICIAGHRDTKAEVLKRLISLGAVEISSKSEDEVFLENKEISDSVALLTNMFNRTKTAIDVLNAYDESKKPMFSMKPDLKRSEIFSESDETYGTVKEISRLNEEIEQLKAQKQKIINERDKLEPYIDLSVPIERTKTKNTFFRTGFFPSDADIDEFLKEIENEYISAEKLSENKDGIYYTFVVLKENMQVFEEISKKYGFSSLAASQKGRVKEIIEAYDKTVSENEKNIEKYSLEIVDYIKRKTDILKYYDELGIRLDLKKAEIDILDTQSAYIINGYIPKSVSKNVELILKKDINVAVFLDEIPDGEEFPVKMSNPAIVEPFEAITEMYSVPASNSIDSSVLLAPFYFLFFGLMLSDAGYGLILTLGAGFILWKVKPTGLFKKMCGLFVLCGISTVIWGVLFGSYFANIGEILTGHNPKPVWFDPMDNPFLLLIFSYILGMIHIVSAMGVKAFMLIRAGQIWDAVFDVGSWYAVFAGVIMLIFPATKAVGVYILILGLLMVLLTQGRESKSIAGKLGGGLWALYGMTGYLADVLSYSRLLALSLATAVVSMVINIMGSLAGNNIFGYIVLAVVFVGGHAFNMTINVLGSYVHTSRLMYIEFFGKFFEAGGRPFKPLAFKSKYTNIAD